LPISNIGFPKGWSGLFSAFLECTGLLLQKGLTGGHLHSIAHTQPQQTSMTKIVGSQLPVYIRLRQEIDSRLPSCDEAQKLLIRVSPGAAKYMHSFPLLAESLSRKTRVGFFYREQLC
jgi:hypothetical protein